MSRFLLTWLGLKVLPYLLMYDSKEIMELL